ncbi:hypothetical protein ACI77I_24570 [Pseudomonas sp. D47]|uniref:hypothetical protein n=1 Tax=Pseudomonas sp. D47 TaxID=3159447 RepID=UPI00387B5A2E
MAGSLPDPLIGGFSASYSTSTSFGGQSSQHLAGSWNKSFEYFTLSANFVRSMNRGWRDCRSSEAYKPSQNVSDNAVYLSASIPMGKSRSLRTYANQRDGRTRLGTIFSDSGHEFGNYQMAADTNTQDRQRDFSGNVNLLPRYTSMNLGYLKSGDDSISYSGQLAGDGAT